MTSPTSIRPLHRPYWMDQTMLTGHRIGEGIDLVDNDREYSVSVDVSQFEPEELTVNIVDNVLTIEGKHEEKTDKFGKVERHFPAQVRSAEHSESRRGEK
ncbi:hypothetical protein OSTOST_25570 [Ostertagia ostertagi]